MKVILIDRKDGRALTFTLSDFSRRLLGAGIALFPLLLGFAAYGVARVLSPDGLAEHVALWHQQLQEQEEALEEISATSQREVDALAVRMAELQARMIRLDALGERLVETARLDTEEFDFSARPAVGGADTDEDGQSYVIPDLAAAVSRLQHEINQRELQLDLLDNLLADRQLGDDIAVSGWPVSKGWISSGYGQRSDPFDGRKKMHFGVDFSSREGSKVIAVASGVVTWAGEKDGFGLAVEVNHGSGYMTRYAHNQENLVAVGDIVKKGEAIARVGSTGRSTGPHLHFEVYKHGRVVDPASYIRRTRS